VAFFALKYFFCNVIYHKILKSKFNEVGNYKFKVTIETDK